MPLQNIKNMTAKARSALLVYANIAPGILKGVLIDLIDAPFPVKGVRELAFKEVPAEDGLPVEDIFQSGFTVVSENIADPLIILVKPFLQ